MALGDYILCCKCEVKLIYDGDRGQREWWSERFGEEPKITCPDCQKEKKFVGLTDEEIPEGVLLAIRRAGLTLVMTAQGYHLMNLGPIEAAHGIKGEA
jgi:hypothetical protein